VRDLAACPVFFGGNPVVEVSLLVWDNLGGKLIGISAVFQDL